jgi:signal transduction histidine kinase
VTRDLHDGAQQRFVTAVINLQLAQTKWSSDPRRARELIDLATAESQAGVDELRELAAGIHPAILTNRGLAAAVEALADRVPIPVSPLEIQVEPLPPAIEASVYFFVSEALTNVVKHARAKKASLRLKADAGTLRVEVVDDGIGGAELSGGSGLPGLADRIAALDGELIVRSNQGEGTTLCADIPLRT